MRVMPRATRRAPVLVLQLQGVLLRRRREAYISPWMEISLKWSSCGSCHDGSKCAILIFVGKVHNALHVEFTVKRTTEVIHNGNNGRFQRRVRGIFPPIKEGDIITGTVIAVSEEEITLDLKYYAQGIIKVEDFSNDPDFAVLEQIHAGDDIGQLW